MRSLAWIALVAGCGGPSGPEALLTVGTDVSVMPWPCDVARANGHLTVGELGLNGSANNLARLSTALSDLDGFPLTGSVFFPLSDALPDAAVPSVAEVVDLTDGPTRTWNVFYRGETNELVARVPRGSVFAEGHVYGVFVQGGGFHPSATMADALAGRGAAAAVYAPLVAWLKSHPDVRPSVATVFTTGHPTAVLDAMREQLYAAPAPKAMLARYFGPADLDGLLGTPTSTRSGFGDPNGVVHDAVGHVLHGTIATPHYLNATPGKLGAIQFDGDGKPMKLAVDSIPFTLVLPKRQSYANTPLAMFQHGINNDRHAAFAVANDFARAGYATLATDTLWHGSRLPGNPDLVNNTTGAATPDGIGDPSAAGAMIIFFDFNGDHSQAIGGLDARIIRDNFRQALLDLLQAVRFAVAGDASALAAADPALADLTLDGSHLVYTGESFGSILGASVLAASPDLRAAVLSVGGAGFINQVMVSSPAFAPLMQPLFAGAFDQLVSVFDPQSLPPEAERSLALLQGAIDPGDPEVWVPRIARDGKSLLLVQAHDDEVLPNQGGDTLAVAAGATPVVLHSLTAWTTPAVTDGAPPPVDAPYAPGSSAIAIVQLEPATHGVITSWKGERNFQPPFPPFKKLPSTVAVDNPTEAVHDLAIGFFDGVRAGAPAVIDVKR